MGVNRWHLVAVGGGLLAAALFAGCGRMHRQGAAVGTVAVVAPHAVEPALEAVHARFLADRPGVKLTLRTEMMDTLSNDLEGGRLSADVCLLPDGPPLPRAEKDGAVEARTTRTWARCPVVLVTRRGNPKRVLRLHDLVRSDIGPVAVPDPQRDAAGVTFVTALKEIGDWNQAERKLRYTGTAYDACRQVEQGAADVAVAYAPSVTVGTFRDKLTLAAHLPGEGGRTVAWSATALASRHRPLVDEYLDFLMSPEAQAALGRAGFTPGAPLPLAGATRSLHVPCGAGLKPATDELGRIYFDRTGVRVDFAYAGAGMLLTTLMTARHGDLYVPGEAFYVDQARQHGLIVEDRPMCYMVPVIGMRKGNPKHVASLRDLTRPGLRVAIGDPKAIAIGPMTERILQRAGLLDAVERNLTMKAACVPELANALATHSADVGIIWDVMAYQNAKDVDSLPIDPKYNEASEVLVSRLTCSKQPGEAKKLMAFLTSDEAKAVFHTYGYSTERPVGMRLAPRAKVGGGKQ